MGVQRPPSAPAPAVVSGSTSPRPNGGSAIYYFYVLDPEFGPGFIKICTYFPYPAKVWVNGHEWAKRQADHAGIAYTALANGFATCDDPDGLQAICDRFGPGDVQGLLRPLDRRRSRPRSPPPTGPPATGGSCRCAKSRCPAPSCSTTPAGPAVLRSARRRQRRHRPPRTRSHAVFGRRVRPAHAPSSRSGPGSSPPAPTCRSTSLQAQPGQAIPQGRQSATHRDRHQQAIRHRGPGPPRAPARARRQGPRRQRPSAYRWNVPVRAVPSALRSSSASTSPTYGRANEPEPCASGTHAPWP